MKSRRPFLILGEALRSYLADRANGAKVRLAQDQLYCFTCKSARGPAGGFVDCIAQTAKTARLMGLCDHCGGTCNRMISATKIASFAEIFNLAFKDGWKA